MCQRIGFALSTSLLIQAGELYLAATTNSIKLPDHEKTREFPGLPDDLGRINDHMYNFDQSHPSAYIQNRDCILTARKPRV
jgi:hypothetical protein